MIKLLLTSIFCFLIAPFIVHSQNITVTGIVKSGHDSENDPPCFSTLLENLSVKQASLLESLPFATVVVKGTSRGVVTDAEGKFSIKAQQGDVLVFTFVGFVTKEVKIKSRSDLGFVVLLQTSPLSSDLPMSYMQTPYSKLGLMEKAYPGYHQYHSWRYRHIYEDQTDFRGYAASAVYGINTSSGILTSKGLQNNGLNHREVFISDALQGKAVGLEIMSKPAIPGAGAWIRLRGPHSIQGNNQPLVVLDGMPINASLVATPFNVTPHQSRLHDLSALQVRKVEIIRGLAGATRWGSFGTNGIIYLTTPEIWPWNYGLHSSPIQVSFKSSFALDVVSKKIPLQKTYGQGQLGISSQYSRESWGDRIAARTGGTDSFITDVNDPNYRGYFESNSGKRYYAIALGGKNAQEIYDPYQAIIQESTTVINSLRITKIIKRVGLELHLEDTQQQGILQNNSDYRRINTDLHIRWIKLRPFPKMRNLSTHLALHHTYGQAVQVSNRLMQYALLAAPDIDINDYEGTYVDPTGARFPRRQRSMVNPLGQQATNDFDTPLWAMQNTPSHNHLHRFIGKFDAVLEDLHQQKLHLTVGYDAYQENRLQSYVPSSTNNRLGGSVQDHLNQGQWFAQLYLQRKRLLLSRTGLYMQWVAGLQFNQSIAKRTSDYSILMLLQDKFSIQNQNLGGYFMAKFIYKKFLFLGITNRLEYDSHLQTTHYPSANLTLHFNESVINERFPSFIDYIRLRVAWGKTGTNLPSYLANRLFNVSNLTFDQDLRPEIVHEVEAGFETRLFKQRLYVGVTIYQNQTTNAIIRESLSGINQLKNAGELTNKGLEAELNLTVFKTKHFNWEMNARYSRNLNQITDLGGRDQIVLDGVSRAAVGQPLGVLYGRKWQRDDAGNLLLSSNGFPQIDSQFQMIGDPNPQFKLAGGSTIRYKNFQLSILFEGSYGGQIWNGTKLEMYRLGTHVDTDHTITLTPAQANLPVYGGTTVAGQYTPQADGSYVVRGRIANFGQNDVLLDETWYRDGLSQVDESFVESASWTRLRELTLSYAFKGKCFRLKTKLHSIRLSLTARNLWIWSRYSGFDPETFYLGFNGQVRGIDYFNLPNTKSYIFTLQITY
ncbi:hypothetical protein BKI52_14845 [marine bacterium AO1-C]|nr:hypothetical protein BKI52_14845 [marine bacterium AO1-C]